MKKKLTITVDADVLPLAKRYAKSKGVSLSSLVEQALREMTNEQELTFVDKWRGRMKPMSDEEIDSARYEYLSRKYLSQCCWTQISFWTWFLTGTLFRKPHPA